MEEYLSVLCTAVTEKSSPSLTSQLSCALCARFRVTGHTLLVSRLQVTFPLIIVSNVKHCDIYHIVMYLGHQCVAQLSV